jgi:CubicO group peptidase (beta-lactamase class C family)
MWRSIAASICRCCAFSPLRDGAAIAAARPSTRAGTMRRVAPSIGHDSASSAANGAVTPGVDAAVAHALQTSRSYRLTKIVLFQGAFAHAPYYIWVKR